MLQVDYNYFWRLTVIIFGYNDESQTSEVGIINNNLDNDNNLLIYII